MGHQKCLIGLLLALAGLEGTLSIAVMSVDLGSEWMKIAVVSPGMPMEICLNRDSQRKTPVVVAFRDGERQFGDMALTTQIKFPSKAFSNFLDLLGKPIDHPVVKDYSKKFPFHKISADENTKGVLFAHPEGMTYTVEELVAMMLKQAQAIAQTTTGQPIKDAVITVPPFFNQAERRALSRAAKIAGINLLQLINDNTAVALNYGVFRRNEFNATPTNILFYDMGTGSTTATVVSFQVGKTKDRGYVETAPIMTVRGVGFNRNLGGLEFKLRLGEHLANKFDELKQASKKVRENPRAVFKLYKEAERVKKILSANTEINAQVENVMEDIDLKVQVTRQEFEDMCADLFARVTQPIDDALVSSQISLEEISQVIVVGGNTRIPKIQMILEEYLQGKGLGKSINADEAAAMGGAYQAAYLSKGFKVKTFVTKDANLYPIQVEFSRDGTKNIQRVVFNRNNEFPKKKTILAARMQNDFYVYVNYGDLTFLSKNDQIMMGKTSNISSVLIKGVPDALKKHISTEVEPKGVRIQMKMDDSGMFHIEQAETLFEKEAIEEEESTLSKIGSTLGKLFGGGDAGETKETPLVEGSKDSKEETSKEPSKSKEEAEITREGPKHQERTKEEKKTGEDKPEGKKSDEKSEEKSESHSKTEEKKEADKDTKKTGKKVEVREPLERKQISLDMPSVSEDKLEPSINKLQELENQDKARLALDKARNALEAFIHETKDKLSTDEYKQASKEDERIKILEALTKEHEWLEYESDGADTETLKGKLASLAAITKEIIDRVNEHRERPQAIESLERLQKLSSDYLEELEKIPEDESVFTAVELETLAKVIKESKEWLIEHKTIQAKTQLHETPVLSMRSIFEKIQVLDRETKYLMNKARYAPSKKLRMEEKDKQKLPDEQAPDDDSVAGDDISADQKILEEILPQGDKVVDVKEGADKTKLPSLNEPEPSVTKQDTHGEL